MNYLGVDVNIKNAPSLDPDFIPLGAFIDSYLKTAKKPVSVAVFRNRGLVSAYDTFINGSPEMRAADYFYIERLVKLLLWTRGGVRVAIFGDDAAAAHIADAFREGGSRAFDAAFMERIYGQRFSVYSEGYDQKVASREESMSVGGNWNGCRIGFDAGGSDRKVSAVIEGKTVYSEEVVWHPKTNTDPDYHYNGILEAMRTAASKMPRVDAIGVSSAGIYIDNRTMVASLFLKVPDKLFDERVKDIYIRAAAQFGDVPLVVANDGDVTALAGAAELDSGCVLGIAMGTSEAAGYVDKSRRVTGWLNELAFAPVDCSAGAMTDEWSGDIGCGVKYFSQDSVIKLALNAGIALDPNDTPAARLKVVQELMQNGDERAAGVYSSIGAYLGHTAPLYAKLYDIKHILLLGRVMSGKGGALIVSEARRILEEEYPDYAKSLSLNLPDEKSRRVGQSVTAAGLPVL